jgi:hypothetical protein
MRIHTHRLGLFAIALMSIGLIQCAEKDADKVGDAQICLNEGRSPSTCMAKVAGLETPAAYSIRCASMFIAERFTDPQKYIDAFAQLNSNSSSLKTFMGLLTFSSGGTIATDNANELIQELTKQYNKIRQQTITNELLDIVGGSMR